jgi:alkylated DNA nucleotide flippase Atl1
MSDGAVSKTAASLFVRPVPPQEVGDGVMAEDGDSAVPWHRAFAAVRSRSDHGSPNLLRQKVRNSIFDQARR